MLAEVVVLFLQKEILLQGQIAVVVDSCRALGRLTQRRSRICICHCWKGPNRCSS